MGRRRPWELTLDIELRSTQGLDGWDGFAGVEPWWVALMVSTGLGPKVILAHVSLVRVDNNVCTDPVFALDNLAADLGNIASAIYDGYHEGLANLGLWRFGNSTVLIAEDVVVDPAWRGHRLGPALLMSAADALRADGIFLIPAALRTSWSSTAGCWVSRYDLPRGDPGDFENVRRCWRRAGFRKLRDSVMWRPAPDDHGVAAREVLSKFESGPLRSSEGMRWSRRRHQTLIRTSS
jgi:GNAT superfamily N-acetyltransferase